MSWLKQAREDLADAIAAMPQFGDTSKTSVIRSWVPEIDAEKLEITEVHIAPQARRTTMASRRCRATSIDVAVGILSPLHPLKEADQAEAGHVLADAIIDGLLAKRIGGTGNMICTAAEQTVTTSVTHWRELRAFASFLTLTLET